MWCGGTCCCIAIAGSDVGISSSSELDGITMKVTQHDTLVTSKVQHFISLFLSRSLFLPSSSPPPWLPQPWFPLPTPLLLPPTPLPPPPMPLLPLTTQPPLLITRRNCPLSHSLTSTEELTNTAGKFEGEERERGLIGLIFYYSDTSPRQRVRMSTELSRESTEVTQQV